MIPPVFIVGNDHSNDGTRRSENMNESWRLCSESRWMSLQMRLGLVPNEGRVIKSDSHRSILHEACSNSNLVRGGLYVQHHPHHGDGRISSLILKSIYYACPEAIMLRDSYMGRTPLHCALAIAEQDEIASTSSISENGHILAEEQRQPASALEQNQPSLDVVCTLLDLSQGGRTPDEEHEDEKEHIVGLIQDYAGDTPLHTACRYGASKHILHELLDSCPFALLKVDEDGMSPVRRLWQRLELSCNGVSLSSIITNDIHRWKDLVRYPNIKDTWNKILMFLHFLSTWELAPDSDDNDDDDEDDDGHDRDDNDEAGDNRAWTKHGSPELSFQILHSIASNECPGGLMKLALKLYPEEFLELDDCGQSVLDIAIAQPVSTVMNDTSRTKSCRRDAGSSSREEATSDAEDVRSVIDVLMEHDASRSGGDDNSQGALYQTCAQNCCHSRLPLHRAILAGRGWNDGVKALCHCDADLVKEVDPVTGLFPFMMAAISMTERQRDSSNIGSRQMSDTTRVETIYELLKRAPEVLLPASTRIASSKYQSAELMANNILSSCRSIELVVVNSGKRKNCSQVVSNDNETDHLNGGSEPKKMKPVGNSLEPTKHSEEEHIDDLPVDANLFWYF